MTSAATRIFFSYARGDADFVLRVARALRAGGHNVWVDQLDIPKGARWDDAVEKALKACTCQLVVLSPASVVSSNVMDEVSYALGETKTIIPLLYKASEVPFRLKRLQYVDFTGDFDEAYRQLLAALPGDEGQAPALAPPAPASPTTTPAAPPIASRPAETAPPGSKRAVLLAIGGAAFAAAALGVYLLLPGRQPPTTAVAPVPSPIAAASQAQAAAAPSDQQLRDFVDKYLAAQGRTNAAELLTFYADKVDFYDQRGVSHNFILKDKSAYFTRWPTVQKRLAGPVQIDRSAKASTYALSYPVDYQVKSAARGDGKSGAVREDLVLREIDGRLLIVSQREQALSVAGK